MKTEKRKIGDLGEDIACMFLVKQGFSVLQKNYLKPWGEIDIIAKKDKKLHFVEVKTLQTSIQASRETSNNVTHETLRPEENVHPAKIKRIQRAIDTYLLEKHVSHETEWQIDVVTVLLDIQTKKAKVDMIENVF